jgi:hypothetical protein
MTTTNDGRGRHKMPLLVAAVVIVGSLRLPCIAQDALPELGARIDFLQNMGELVSAEIERRQTPLVFERSAPPLMNQAARKESEVKARWMGSAVQQAADSYQRATETNDPAVRGVWLRDAATKADTAHRLVKYYLGDDVDMRRPSPEAKRAIEEVSAQHAAVNADMREVIRLHFQITASEDGGLDPEHVARLVTKQKELEAASNRHLQSAEKFNDANFVAEANFWRRDTTLQYEKITRLASEIIFLSTRKDIEALPELVQALRSNDPVARKDAETIIAGLVTVGRGPEVLPKLVELIRKLPREVDSSLPTKGGIFSQMDRRAEERERKTRPGAAYQRTIEQNQEEFDKTGGVSGAGGISLHAAARFIPAIDAEKATRAYVEDGRLTLLYDGRPVHFPRLDLEFLALALRNVIGGEGAIQGTLLVDTPNGIVVQTPKDQFGQVVWKKGFLPSSWKAVKKGDPVTILLGPSFGISAAPGVSTNRATYYGPVADTRFGKVLFEADALLTSLINGIDISTGRPTDLPQNPAFATGLERRLKSQARTQSREATATRSGEVTSARKDELTPWLGTWFVWVPDRFDLQLTQDAREFRFVETRMKLAVWSLDENSVDPGLKELGEEATLRFDELAEWRPILKELVEVAKAVTIVRWLKQARVPVGMEWARSYEIEPLATPSTTTRYKVVFDPAVDLSRLHP